MISAVMEYTAVWLDFSGKLQSEQGALCLVGGTEEDDNSFSLLKFLKKSETFSPAFFNILKEPLMVQKQTIPVHFLFADLTSVS